MQENNTKPFGCQEKLKIEVVMGICVHAGVSRPLRSGLDGRLPPGPGANNRLQSGPYRGNGITSGSSGRGAAWQRVCFGSRKSGVQIPPPRPSFSKGHDQSPTASPPCVNPTIFHGLSPRCNSLKINHSALVRYSDMLPQVKTISYNELI